MRMRVNRGKDFEKIIFNSISCVESVSIDRIHDQTTGYAGSSNICDFIVYKYPRQLYLECKTVHGASLPFRNITKRQWEGLLQKSNLRGVFAGILCWWVDKDTTLFLPIRKLDEERKNGKKSIRYDVEQRDGVLPLTGRKKRVLFEYDVEKFLNEF